MHILVQIDDHINIRNLIRQTPSKKLVIDRTQTLVRYERRKEERADYGFVLGYRHHLLRIS